MKLKKALIQNYRSIVDSTLVDIEDGVTVIIGKNEQGKSTFLNAIRSFNSSQHYTPNDLPNHLRPELEDRNPTEIPIITLWFGLEPQDHKKLEATIANLITATGVKASKHYGNNYTFTLTHADGTESQLLPIPRDMGPARTEIKRVADELRTKLLAHAERLPAFAANKDNLQTTTTTLTETRLSNPEDADDLIKTFTTSIKVLTGQDQPIIDDITAAIAALEKVKESIHADGPVDPVRVLQESLPVLVLHSTTSDHIPNEVPIADFVANPDATSKGMANLCRAAGLSVQKIRDLAATTDTSQREAYEDHHKGTISGGLNEFWTQTEYHVHFRIEKERLSVSISDTTYTKRIPPSDRSEGFRWYLSFYATLLNDVGTANQTILLLDNPALELHLDGQHDIKRFLEEKIAPTSQVIYVSHSPAMIDPYNLKQVRAVAMQPNQQGTRITNFLSKTGNDADLLEPVRAAMGMSLVSSLVMNNWNILVEGAADKPIIEGIFVSHYPEHRHNLIVNGSVSESKDAFLVRFYHRTGLPYAVVLDADSSGRDIEQGLLSHGIPQNRIIRLDKVFTERQSDFAIEDIISPAFYYQAVTQSYPNQPIEQPTDTNKKRATQYEDAFRTKHQIGFSKRRVADTVKQLLGEYKEDQETKTSLGTLSTAIMNCLNAQTTAQPSESETTAEHA